MEAEIEIPLLTSKITESLKILELGVKVYQAPTFQDPPADWTIKSGTAKEMLGIATVTGGAPPKVYSLDTESKAKGFSINSGTGQVTYDGTAISELPVTLMLTVTDGNGATGTTDIVVSEEQLPPPPPPVIEVVPGPETLTVTWTCKEDVKGQGVGRYVLEWRLSPGGMYSGHLIGCTAGTKNTFIIDGLLPETNYEVRVTANVQGSSQDFKGSPPYSEKTVRTRRARTPGPVVRTPGGGGGGAPSPPPPPPPPVAPPPSDTEPSPDRAPLLALYQAAGGESWENKWYTDFPVDDWHGVRTNEDDRVTELDLSDNGLGGEIEEITEEIGKLSYLETLDLSGNPDLSGELPSDLMELENLRTLDIQNTGLCAPLDEAFQDWLMGITFRGEYCAEETVDQPQVSGGGGCSVSSLGETGDGALSLFLVVAALLLIPRRRGLKAERT